MRQTAVSGVENDRAVARFERSIRVCRCTEPSATRSVQLCAHRANDGNVSNDDANQCRHLAVSAAAGADVLAPQAPPLSGNGGQGARLLA